jgi:hypothetical protein
MRRFDFDDLGITIVGSVFLLLVLCAPTWAALVVQSIVQDTWFGAEENPAAIRAIHSITAECRAYVQLNTVSRARYDLCRRVLRHNVGCETGDIPENGEEDADGDTQYGCTVRDQHKFLMALGFDLPNPFLPEHRIPRPIRIGIWSVAGVAQLAWATYMLLAMRSDKASSKTDTDTKTK